MNLSLYAIANTAADIEAFLDSEAPLDAEQEALLTQALDRALHELLPAKVENYCKAMRAFDAFEAGCKDEEERIRRRRKAVENVRERMKERLRYALETTGQAKVEAGTFVVALQANPPAVEVEQEALVPAQYQVVTTTLDKRAMLAALKAGDDVPGAKLVRGQHVRIR